MPRGTLLLICLSLISTLTFAQSEKNILIKANSEEDLRLNVEILETKIICKQDSRYLGWPTIVRKKDGELLVTFSGDRDSHVCPWGKVQIIRSSDNGKTWSEAQTIMDSPIDDRDAGIIQTTKGTLLVSTFTSLAFASPSWPAEYKKYKDITATISQETRKKWLGNWVLRSEDEGQTWSTPIRTNGNSPHGPIQLANGSLLHVGTETVEGVYTIIVEGSENDGKSWSNITTIPIPVEFTNVSEPHIVQLKDGKIIAMFRHEPQDRSKCYLLQSESNDNGKTWTRLHQTSIWGFPPHLIELNNGWILASYGYRRTPYGQRACISRDGGGTWDLKNEFTLSVASNGDLGYPASVQLEDGSILSVYYQQYAPGYTAIMSTLWQIK